MAEPIVRIQPGATGDRDEDALAHVRQQTHDWLIETCGDARVGPVEWRHWEAPRGIRVLHVFGLDDDPEWRDLIRFLRAHPGGMLVLASVEVDPDLLPEGS